MNKITPLDLIFILFQFVLIVTLTMAHLMQVFKEFISFNLFVADDEGQVAWSVTPVVLDELSNPLEGTFLSDEIDVDTAESSFIPQIYTFDEEYFQPESLQTQSKPLDGELFLETPKPDTLPARKPTNNHETVRIYANSLRLRTSPFADYHPHPSVISIERAALCKIFLETKYHKTASEPNERLQRRQALEQLVSKNQPMTLAQRQKFDEIVRSVESEWSRLSRVRPSIEAFEVLQKLGSGGFGVVNMVREKATRRVYAMKVCPRKEG